MKGVLSDVFNFCQTRYRPLKRFIQRELETQIGRALIAGGILDGAEVFVEMEEGKPFVHHKNTIDQDLKFVA